MLHELLDRIDTRPPAYQIAVSDDGFVELQRGLQVRLVFWDDVERVVAFKRDLGSTDRVYLAFFTRALPEPVLVGEDDDGYVELTMKMLERLAGCDPLWEQQVVRQPTEPSVTLVYACDAHP